MLRSQLTAPVMIACLEACASGGLAIPRTPEGLIHDYHIGVGSSRSGEVIAIQEAERDALFKTVLSGMFVAQTRELDSIRVITSRRIVDHEDSVRIRRIVTAINSPDRAIRGYEVVERASRQSESGWSAWAMVRADKSSGLKSVPDRRDFVVRSIFPGAGQFAKGTPKRGYAVIGVVGGGIVGGAVFRESANRSRERSRAATTRLDRDYYEKWAGRFSTMQTVSWSAAVVGYVYSITDALTGEVHIYPYGATSGVNGIAVILPIGRRR